jgi:predicted dehydrogenase
MNEVSKNSKAKFTMMFNQRTNSLYRKMKEMIDNKEIGELQRVSWIITDWFRTESYYRNGSWRATWQGEGGGVLINQCPHQLDLLQWIVGLPKKVNAFCHYGKWHDIEVEDDVTAYLEFDGGATGIFVTTTGEAPGSNRFEVSGSKGKLVCENNTLLFYKNELDNIEVCKNSDKGFDTPNVEIIKVETDNKNEQHLGIINNFTNSLLGLEERFVEGIEGIRNVELMNAIELSGFRNGESVYLPVDEEEYLKELNKKRASSKFKECNEEIVMDTSNSF